MTVTRLVRHMPHEPWSAKLCAPFAVLGIRSDGCHITDIAFLPLKEKEAAPADALSEQAVRELTRYLDDPQFAFTVPILPRGTLFQQRVWEALQAIPASSTRTYGELAKTLKSAPRAVGGACGANPVVLVIPCHRVVAQRSLGGFMHAGDGEPLHIKRWLLKHENALPGV
ncbi:MAG: methylated-DNA--[protein]-cysteine S-methyltransferase [Burkholderiales bacterium]|jgi:methylated-DNA-[protein]-cysteine S-methyltransferase|nr:methylated-DNA--[protein]-cysteine S-methyltransferase [Burkholderiales bacterium]